MAKFETYCNPRTNTTWERHIFNTRTQQPGEPIDHFITDLHLKAKTCEFNSLADSLIKDRIVEGINDAKTRSRLLREADLSLQKALDICRASEACASQMKSFNPTDNEAAGVNQIEKKKDTNPKSVSCGRCGGHPRQSYPAMGAQVRDKKTLQPNVQDHRTIKRTTPRYKVHNIDEGSSDEDSTDLYIRTVKRADAKHEEEWRTILTLNDKKIVFKLDTGAKYNVISKKAYDSISKRPPQKTRTRVIAFGGHRLNTYGKTTILSEYKGKYRVLEFMIVNGDVQNVLGRKTCTKLKLVGSRLRQQVRHR